MAPLLVKLVSRPGDQRDVVELRDFSADGATKSEWQRTCADVPERSFHRACKALLDAGYVKAVGTHFRMTEKAGRL